MPDLHAGAYTCINLITDTHSTNMYLQLSSCLIMFDRRALWNLTKARPSTAPVGNDALMAALRQLGSDRGADLAVWKFMSAGDQRALGYTCEVQISRQNHAFLILVTTGMHEPIQHDGQDMPHEMQQALARWLAYPIDAHETIGHTSSSRHSITRLNCWARQQALAI